MQAVKERRVHHAYPVCRTYLTAGCASGERVGHREARQGLALLNEKFSLECVNICRFHSWACRFARHLLDTFSTPIGQLFDTYWTLFRHPLGRPWLQQVRGYPTAEYAESAERVGRWHRETVAHECGYFKRWWDLTRTQMATLNTLSLRRRPDSRAGDWVPAPYPIRGRLFAGTPGWRDHL